MIDEWFRLAGPAAESTRGVYDGYVRRQVLSHLGHVKVRDLRVVDLDRWYQQLIDDGLAPASIRKAHNIVRAALRQRVRWGWVPLNVAAHSSPPVAQKPVVPTPTPDVVKQLIAFIEPHDPEFALYVRLSGVLGENGAACRLPPRRDSSNSGALAFRCDGRVGRGQQMSSTRGGQSRRCSASAEEYAGVVTQ